MLLFINFLMVVCSNLGFICRPQYKHSGTYLQCGRNICSDAYTSNVQCMYASASHIIDCTEFIWVVYADLVVSYVDMK